MIASLLVAGATAETGWLAKAETWDRVRPVSRPLNAAFRRGSLLVAGATAETWDRVRPVSRPLNAAFRRGSLLVAGATAETGGPDQDRTDDLLNAIEALFQLSYEPVPIARDRTIKE